MDKYFNQEKKGLIWVDDLKYDPKKCFQVNWELKIQDGSQNCVDEICS